MVFNFLPWLLDGATRPEYIQKQSQADNAYVVIQDLDITLM